MNSSRTWIFALALGVWLLAAASPSAAQGFRWWHAHSWGPLAERFEKEMALTPDQVSRIEEIFQASIPDLRARKRVLDKLEDELSVMVREAHAHESEVEAFVARVEAARAELNKARTLQLFRIRRVLSLDQHLKLQELFRQRERDRHRQGRQQHGQF